MTNFITVNAFASTAATVNPIVATQTAEEKRADSASGASTAAEVRANIAAETESEQSEPISNNIKENHLFETADISAILPYIDSHSLVIFDLDYTLFRSKTNLGTPEWSLYLMKQYINQGLSREASIKKAYPVWMKAQKFNEIMLMDDHIPKLLLDVKKKALGFIALTSRRPEAFEITEWQLHKFGIDFNKSPVSDFKFEGAFDHPVLYHAGILFAHDVNPKGRVLDAWLNQYRDQLGKRRHLRKIVFVDDSEEHLLSVKKTAEALGIEFIGFRYNRADDFKATLSQKLADEQQKILMANHSDTETRLLLEQLGSYVE